MTGNRSILLGKPGRGDTRRAELWVSPGQKNQHATHARLGLQPASQRRKELTLGIRLGLLSPESCC